MIVKTEWIITVRHSAESHNSQLSDASKNDKNDKEMENIEHNCSISFCKPEQHTSKNRIIVETVWIITVRHAAESHDLQLLDAPKIVKNDKGMGDIECN